MIRLALAFVALSFAVATARSAQVTYYQLPSGAYPHDVAPALDGAVWFTGQAQGFLGHFDPASGKLEKIPLGRGAALPVRLRRRRWPYVVALPALVVLIGIGVYVYLTVFADSELQAAIAETDRLDPRWRLKDVEANRAVVPEAENSGTVAMAVKRQLPNLYPFWDVPPTPTPQDPPDAGPVGSRA